jgi:ABC-type sugar transport system substrate-binding protein
MELAQVSNEIIVKLEEGLYEDYKEELEKKYYGGINKVLGEPWFTKTDAEIEAEAEKKVKEFMDRNS